MTKLRLLEDYWSRATFDLENMPELIVDEPKPAGKSLRDYNRTRHALWRPKKYLQNIAGRPSTGKEEWKVFLILHDRFD
jgi:hypothetical protein